jgi:hypothetical protein
MMASTRSHVFARPYFIVAEWSGDAKSSEMHFYKSLGGGVLAG